MIWTFVGGDNEVMQYYCPACFAPVERGVVHCPVCGVNIAEWEQGHTYTERLVHALRHPNPEARMSAIITLGNWGDAGAALPLAECALAHPLDVTQGLAVVKSIRRLPWGAEKQGPWRCCAGIPRALSAKQWKIRTKRTYRQQNPFATEEIGRQS